jgi:hypothetical protein
VRAAGEGVYALLRVGGDMRLAWCLELPDEPGQVQRALNIPPEASLIVSIRNPEKPAPPDARLDPERRADYSDELQETFRGRKFASEEPRLLDVDWAQIVFVGARENAAEAYDIDFQPADEALTNGARRVRRAVAQQAALLMPPARDRPPLNSRTAYARAAARRSAGPGGAAVGRVGGSAGGGRGGS